MSVSANAKPRAWSGSYIGVYTRPDSPWFWLWLETAPPGQQREKTAVRVGTTPLERTDSRRLAQQIYSQRMTELAARIHRLPTARPSIRFDAYATTYATDVISAHKGHEREHDLLNRLLVGFGRELLQTIDRDRVRAYMTARRQQNVSARTVNREIDLLKAMLRDAVPKYLEASPIVGMKRLPVLTPKRRLLTGAEERRLLAKASRTERALLLVARDGLVRLKDALELQRSDHKGAWLYIRDPKSGAPYEVALSRRAEQALNAVPGTGPYFFAIYRGAKTDRDRRSRVRRVLIKLCLKAGVVYGKAKGGITFHWATRRTGATRLLVQGKIPVPTVQRQGNWKTPDVLLQIYAESDRRAQRAAVRPLTTRSRQTRKRA